MPKRHRESAEPPTMFLIFFFSNFVCGFLLEKSKRRKKSICLFSFFLFPSEQREPRPRLLSRCLLTGERRETDSSSGVFGVGLRGASDGHILENNNKKKKMKDNK